MMSNQSLQQTALCAVANKRAIMKPIESLRMTARRGQLIVAATSILLFLSAPASSAGILPALSVTGLCAEAAVIAEGDHVGNGRVKVLKIYKGSEQVGTNREIVVAGLEKCSKRLASWRQTNEVNIQTDHVVLFMDAQLRPLYLIGDGSGGVFWLSDDACFKYGQMMNPGGYVLAKLGMKPDALRKEIELGLAVATEWEAIKALKEPKAMAERMAAYLRGATWPKGYHGEFYSELRQRIPKLGADAVSPVVEVLRATMKADEDSNFPVLILCAIGKPAQPAVPLLLELLQKPGKTSQYYICAALRTAGDPQAIPSIRPLLRSGDMQIAVEAAAALGALGDKESFDAIATLVWKEKDSIRLRALLSALHQLDSERAAGYDFMKP